MTRIRIDTGRHVPIVKWAQTKPGHVLEGVYLGQHEGKYGPLADLDTLDGQLQLPVPAMLGRALAQIRIGGYIYIQYDGLQSSKEGRDYHGFTVWVEDKADKLPATPTGDGEVPF
jgi:hypothetical protein